MSFDWGGFMGGIIGTMGAWGVAWWTIKQQEKKEKPTIIKKKYILVNDMTELFVNGLNALNTDHEHREENLDYASAVVYEIQAGLRKLLPEALETDVDIYDLFSAISNELSGLFVKYSPFQLGEDYVNPERYDDFIEEFQTLAIHTLDKGSTINKALKNIAIKAVVEA